MCSLLGLRRMTAGDAGISIPFHDSGFGWRCRGGLVDRALGQPAKETT
jgi:hypothetical protein